MDVHLLERYRKSLDNLDKLLGKIATDRPKVIKYRDAEQNLFAKEPEIRKSIKEIEQQIAMMLSCLIARRWQPIRIASSC